MYRVVIAALSKIFYGCYISMDLVFWKSLMQYTMIAGIQNELQKDLSLLYKKT